MSQTKVKTSKSNKAKKTKFPLQFSFPPQLSTVVIVVLIILAGLLAFPFRFLIIPAIVNGQPIFSWNYLRQLHQTSGDQVLDQMISQLLIEQEVSKQGIQVSQEEINEQTRLIEERFSAEGNDLDTVLSLQGLSRNQFIKELRLNLALEKLIKGTIKISEEEIATELAENSLQYQQLSDADAATTAAENIRTQKLSEVFQTWFQEVRSQARIKTFFK
jgi:foldase protein PrsA